MRWNNAFGKKIIKQFFTKDKIEEIKNAVYKLTEENDKKDYVWKFYESNNNNINRIEYFVNHNNYLNELANSKKILCEVNSLMGEESILFKDKINYKYPNGEVFKPHQDISAGWGNYTNKHISFLIPLCDTNDENGGIYFGKKVTKQLTPNFTDLTLDLEYELVCTNLGDVILFDSYIPHTSYKNISKNFRPLLFFTYTPKADGSFYEIYHSDKFKNVPPDIYKEKGKAYRSGNSNIKKIYTTKSTK
jgi:ectoine hydroxylase-related dioxygenase (phytanoyl-CoA dioxygenase family)|tara:strand:- start:9 stop:749 length:741 start_codon:yes stop_codon:yes gene_type:complete